MFRDVLSAVSISDEYNVPITQFINQCREVQTVSPQEEANVVILLRAKLHG